MRTLIGHPRGGTWLTRRRLVTGATVLLIVEIALLAIVIVVSRGLIGPRKPAPGTTDFVSFYAAGRLTDAGTPALAYDHAAHHIAEEQSAGAGIPYIYFYYPPIYLLLCAVFAWLPYLVSFVAFQVTTLFACLVTLRAILRETRWTVTLPLIAFPPAFWAMGLGQNAFLTAALFGTATLSIDRRPVLAGLLFGAICYKPHFGLLIPVALAAGGHWRAFVASGVTVLSLCSLSILLFGWETWHAYLTAFAGSHTVYATGTLDFAAFVSPFGAARALGVSPVPAYAMQLAATLVAAAAVGIAWHRRLSLPVRAAILTAATPIAIPVALIYDLLLSAIAMAWLVRAGQEQGFAPRERAALAILFVLPLAGLNMDEKTYLLVPPTVAVGVFVLAWLRARREMIEQAVSLDPRTGRAPLGAA
jgi:alpha-1,2-mannosyltransferase